MPALPSGTVTFVFSDIEDSTALVKQLGERYDELLTTHRRLVREGFAAYGGVEIDTQGDAFFFAFPRARDAVTAAVAAQRAHADHDWPEGVDVRVRMGLHTGEPAMGTEGYLGLDVVRAARLCTAGGGGHVLLSEATRALVGSSLPEGVSIFPLGERRLKGIDEPERVFELDIAGVARSEEPVEAAAPTAEEAAWEADFGKRLSERIEASVRRSLESSLDRAMSSVDALADRASKRPGEIAERLDEEG
jgi:class 3 adenylate cyclase